MVVAVDGVESDAYAKYPSTNTTTITRPAIILLFLKISIRMVVVLVEPVGADFKRVVLQVAGASGKADLCDINDAQAVFEVLHK